MSGVRSESGINCFATTCLLRGGLHRRDLDCLIPLCRKQLSQVSGGSLSKYMLAILETVLTGASRARYQLEKMDLADNTTCPHCASNLDETKDHMFWECPAWQYIRDATVERFCPGVWERHRHAVTRVTGITILPDWVLEEWNSLANMSQVKPPEVPWDSAQHHFHQDARGVLVWTDGSTDFPSIPELTRSGLGVFYQAGSNLNFCAALAGELQTNSRAELLAVVLAAEQAVSWSQPMVVHSDSSWVVTRASILWHLFLRAGSIMTFGYSCGKPAAQFALRSCLCGLTCLRRRVRNMVYQLGRSLATMLRSHASSRTLGGPGAPLRPAGEGHHVDSAVYDLRLFGPV